MLNDIINNERDLLATLITIRDLTIEHNIFPLKGMIEQIDKLIERSETVLISLRKWKINNQKGETNG